MRCHAPGTAAHTTVCYDKLQIQVSTSWFRIVFYQAFKLPPGQTGKPATFQLHRFARYYRYAGVKKLLKSVVSQKERSLSNYLQHAELFAIFVNDAAIFTADTSNT